MATGTVSAGVAGAPVVCDGNGDGNGDGGGDGAGAGAGAVAVAVAGKGATGGGDAGSVVGLGASFTALASAAGSWGTLACGVRAGRSAGGCTCAGTGTGIWRGSGG